MDRTQRLNQIARIAVAVEAQTRLPAALLIAQWAVESQWGAKPVGQANYFGMKKAARHRLGCSVETHEVVHGQSIAVTQEFADYRSLEESCRDYAWLITRGAPYAPAWAEYQASQDFDRFARTVLGIYATAQYGALALQIAQQANVQAALGEARQALST